MSKILLINLPYRLPKTNLFLRPFVDAYSKNIQYRHSFQTTFSECVASLDPILDLGIRLHYNIFPKKLTLSLELCSTIITMIIMKKVSHFKLHLRNKIRSGIIFQKCTWSINLIWLRCTSFFIFCISVSRKTKFLKYIFAFSFSCKSDPNSLSISFRALLQIRL